MSSGSVSEMTRHIFIGSSREALKHAKAVKAVLGDVDGIKPMLWEESFKVGEITFVTIEDVVNRIAGAVFLATPDDDSVIRRERVKVPRANVLFEYGYVTARLARNRVALCRYDGVELPSDFEGLTYIPMGRYGSNLSNCAISRLRAWASGLGALQSGIPAVLQVHGYSGVWRGETTFEIWRGIKIKRPNYAQANTRMVLHLPMNACGTTGCIYGTLQVQVGKCYAEFHLNDEIVGARVLRDGSLRISLVMQSRQRTVLEGDPPQKDGFGPVLRGGREFGLTLHATEQEGVMTGNWVTSFGGGVLTKGRTTLTRVTGSVVDDQK